MRASFDREKEAALEEEMVEKVKYKLKETRAQAAQILEEELADYSNESEEEAEDDFIVPDEEVDEEEESEGDGVRGRIPSGYTVEHVYECICGATHRDNKAWIQVRIYKHQQ